MNSTTLKETKKNSNLLLRIISGAVFIVLVTLALTINPWLFFIIFGFFMVVALQEYYNISTANGLQPDKKLGTIIGIAVFGLMFLHANQIISAKYLSILPALLCIVPIIEIYRKQQSPLVNWAAVIFSQVYIAMSFGLMSYLLFATGEFSGKILLSIFVIIWISDTGAYCAGTLFGKHKLIPRISPKKTIEGLAGGVILALISSYPIYLLSQTFTFQQWIIIATICVIFANFGDLAESLIKRNAGVKDSGTIMPGHGGILDRFDSALLAIPPVWCVITLINN